MMSEPTVLEMVALGAKASLARHVTRSLSATAKRLKKEKGTTRDFIINSLSKGELKWKELKLK